MSELIFHRQDKNIKLHGRETGYTVTAEEYPLYSETGELEASMFGYSYTAAQDAPGRPVVFAYNGGPGSDSTWLHFGLLGPRRMEIREPDEGL